MLFSIIKKRNFRNFFFSDIISGFGVGMSFIGANWFLMDQTNSLQSLGFMLSLNVIAGFLVFPYVGTITDKFNRKTIIFWAHIIRAIVILGVCSTFLFSGFKIEFLYLLAVLNGIGWTVYMSASRSLIQELLDAEDLINGNSLIEISLQVGMFMAAAVSGFLYAFFGFWLILLINAMAFLISTLFLVRIKYSPMLVEDKEETFYVNFKKGLTYLKERPGIFLLGVAAVIPLVTTMTFNVVLPGYVNLSLNGSSVVFGFADMFYGCGGLLAGFIAAPLAKKISKNGATIVFFLISIGTLVAAAVNSYIFVLYLISVLFGLGNSSIRIVMNTTIMENVSKSYMGRAMSVWMAISLLLQTVSASGVGLLMDSLSPRAGFIWMSVLMLMGLGLFSLLINNVKSKKDIAASS